MWAGALLFTSLLSFIGLSLWLRLAATPPAGGQIPGAARKLPRRRIADQLALLLLGAGGLALGSCSCGRWSDGHRRSRRYQ